MAGLSSDKLLKFLAAFYGEAYRAVLNYAQTANDGPSSPEAGSHAAAGPLADAGPSAVSKEREGYMSEGAYTDGDTKFSDGPSDSEVSPPREPSAIAAEVARVTRPPRAPRFPYSSDDEMEINDSTCSESDGDGFETVTSRSAKRKAKAPPPFKKRASKPKGSSPRAVNGAASPVPPSPAPATSVERGAAETPRAPRVKPPPPIYVQEKHKWERQRRHSIPD